MSTSTPWRRYSDKATLYLPALLMGLLALGTWWLVRNAPQSVASGTQKVRAHEPDYFMKDFSVKNFEATGRLKTRLTGTEGRHYPDTDTLEVDDARMLSIAPDGRTSVSSAKRALSNGDGSEIQLFGNAVITREAVVASAGKKASPPMKIESEFLQIWPNDERISTNKPVVMTRGNDRFNGDGMEYGNLDQVLQMNGRVKGTIQPSNR